MDVRLLTGTEELGTYDAWVKSHPSGSLWQSLEWKAYQESLGRETKIYALMEGAQILASALVIIDRTVFGLSAWDIPRGPLIAEKVESGKLKVENMCEKLFKQIIEDAQNDRCLTLYFSPAKSLSTFHFQLSTSLRHEQPSATRVIDLTLSEEAIRAQMKPKGRYNITVAEKNGVRIEESQDISAFYTLLQETGGRDQFGIKPKKHYEAFLSNLPNSFLLLASPEARSTFHFQLSTFHSPIAGLLGVIWGKKGIYYYGASKYDSRALMAPYALQWATMRRCKALGCTSYDLLGIASPPALASAVAPPDAGTDHPWYGVSTFKEKFGGQIVTYPPEQQIVLRPMTSWMLGMKRKLLG